MGLLRNLQPTWWFAAHLHTRFEARVRHYPALETTTTSTSSRSGPQPRAENPDEITIDDDEVEDRQFDSTSGGATVPRVAGSIPPPTPQNPDEISLDDEIEAVEPPPPLPPPTRETRFLALDKCLPQRQFLEASPPPSPRSENQSTNLFRPSDKPSGRRYPHAGARARGRCSRVVLRPRMASNNPSIPTLPLP